MVKETLPSVPAFICCSGTPYFTIPESATRPYFTYQNQEHESACPVLGVPAQERGPLPSILRRFACQYSSPWYYNTA
eukprot:115373-Rhodomonas_salina.2